MFDYSVGNHEFEMALVWNEFRVAAQIATNSYRCTAPKAATMWEDLGSDTLTVNTTLSVVVAITVMMAISLNYLLGF